MNKELIHVGHWRDLGEIYNVLVEEGSYTTIVVAKNEDLGQKVVQAKLRFAERTASLDLKHRRARSAGGRSHA